MQINQSFYDEFEIIAPKYNASQAYPIEFKLFSYNNWNTNSSILPRVFNQSLHEKSMKLLYMTTTLLAKHKIEYMIVYGTLMG